MVHIVERLYLSRHEQEACEILATDEIPGYMARGNIWQLLARRVRVRSCISVESTRTAHAHARVCSLSGSLLDHVFVDDADALWACKYGSLTWLDCFSHVSLFQRMSCLLPDSVLRNVQSV